MFKIGDEVKSKETGRKGFVERGDRPGTAEPSWARGCVMVRFEGSSDAITTPTSGIEKVETAR